MWKITLRVLITSALVIGIYVALSWFVVEQSLVAKPKVLDKYPTEFGLRFEPVTFNPVDDASVNLRGWWIPHEEPRAVIVWVHGLDGARDDRMELLSDLHSGGYSILTFDLRGHGESDKVSMGAGAHEQKDVLGAIQLIEAKTPDLPIALAGVSFGAAIIILVADEAESVRAVVADSSFASIPELIEEEVSSRTPVPVWVAGLLKPGIILAAKWFKDADITKVSPANGVGDLPFPIALIHCEDSIRVPFSHAERIWEQAPNGSHSLFVSGCDHAEGYEQNKEIYVGFVLDYLDSRMSR